MKASFDKQELMSGLAELEKRVREHRPSGQPAAPSERLELDLASIEAAVKSRRALSKPAAVDVTAIAPEDAREQAAPSQSTTIDVAPPEKQIRVSSAGSERAPAAAALEAAALFAAEPREQTATSASAAIDLVADKEFRASASGDGSSLGAVAVKDPALRVVDPASPSPSVRIDAISDKEFRAPALGTSAAASRPHRWIYAATAILIVVGSLVGGASWLVGGKVLAALQTPRTLRSRIDPPLAATVTVPAPEQTADVPPAPSAAAQETATAAETAPPAPAPQAAAPTVEANATQGIQAPESAPVAAALPTAPATAAPSPAVAPPPAAKSAAAVEPPAGAAAPPTSEAPAAKPAKPAKKSKKPTADKSEDKSDKDAGSKRHAKAKPEKVVKPHPAPEASARQAPAQPQALAAPPPQALAAPPPPPPPPAAANPEPGVLARAGQAVGSITGTVKGWVGLDSGAHP